MQIHVAARKHGVQDRDIRHAYEQTLAWVEIDHDPRRYLLVGPDSAGNLLELVVVITDADEIVIHAMKLRRSTAAAILGVER